MLNGGSYSHYDVVNAGAPHAWDHDPFQLTGFNGYLYGRGVSDNKGPVLAVACAASEMLARRSLDIDLVLLIEGEEEAGSGGFTEAVQKYKVGDALRYHGRLTEETLQDEIGHIDAILVRWAVSPTMHIMPLTLLQQLVLDRRREALHYLRPPGCDTCHRRSSLRRPRSSLWSRRRSSTGAHDGHVRTFHSTRKLDRWP